MSDDLEVRSSPNAGWLEPTRKHVELVKRGMRDVKALSVLPSRDFIEGIRSIYLAARYRPGGKSVDEIMADLKESLAEIRKKSADQKHAEWLETERRAGEGDVDAQCTLGLHYSREDPVESAKWYLRAAEQGDASAQFAIGDIYLEGKGLRQDYAAALYWLLKAAAQDHEEARWCLVDLYNAGIGVEQNLEEAARWLRIDAERGFSHSQFWLGRYYRMGRGVPIDLVQSYLWTTLAAASGSDNEREKYIQSLEELAAGMSSTEIARAHRLTSLEAERMLAVWKSDE